MADKEIIAATLAAAMLPSFVPPAMNRAGVIDKDEQARFLMDVFHAVALYRAVLEALGQTDRGVRIPAARAEEQTDAGRHAGFVS